MFFCTGYWPPSKDAGESDDHFIMRSIQLLQVCLGCNHSRLTHAHCPFSGLQTYSYDPLIRLFEHISSWGLTSCSSMTVDPASKVLRPVPCYATGHKKYLKSTLESYSNSMSRLWIAGDMPQRNGQQRSTESIYSHRPEGNFACTCLERLLSIDGVFFPFQKHLL